MTHFLTRSLYITAALACAAAWFAAAPAAQAQATTTNATTTATVELRMEKKFSGPDEGYVASDFSFHLTGNGVDTMLNHNGTINLTAGTYRIEEIGPNDFDPDDWRIQWSGECDGVLSNNMQATLTIDDGNIDSGFLDCRADNQYRPEDTGFTTPGTTTVELRVEKKFSGPDEGYAASDFTFHVTGNGVDTMLDHNGTFDLTAGTYRIEEIGPNGFNPNDWRIQWSGACSDDDGNNMDATLTVDAGNVDHNYLACRADNQFRPVGDGRNGTTTPTTTRATLIVVKEVVGTTTPPDSFAFSLYGTNASTTYEFEADGDNEFSLATGTYSVVEVGTSSAYTVTYNNCTDVTLDAGDTETCTIINTVSTNGNGGDNGGGDDGDDDNGNGGGGNDDNDNGGGSGGGNNDDDDNGGGGRSSGGGGSSNNPTSSDITFVDSSGFGNTAPGGQVAGAQTSIVPAGAANAGGGGTSENGFLPRLWNWFTTLF